MLLDILALTSCQQEEIPNAEDNTPRALSIQVNVANYLPFTSEAYTRVAVVGMPDVGKTKWVDGDNILIMISLYLTADMQGAAKKQIPLTYQYDGMKWNCIEGDFKVKPYKDQYNQHHNYKAARITGYYLPTHRWLTRSDGSTILEEIKDVHLGSKEAFACKSIEQTDANGLRQLDLNIDFSEEMKSRPYSRIRIVANSGSKVQIQGVGFLTASNIARGEYTRLYKWEATSKAIVFADLNGNAFFYGKWESPITFTVKTLTSSEKTKTITVSLPSINGTSYVIDMR